LLAGLIALLILTRAHWLPTSDGVLNALNTNRTVKNNPDFHENIGMTNLAYDKA